MSERRTAVWLHISDDFHTNIPSDARARPPSLIAWLGLFGVERSIKVLEFVWAELASPNVSLRLYLLLQVLARAAIGRFDPVGRTPHFVVCEHREKERL